MNTSILRRASAAVVLTTVTAIVPLALSAAPASAAGRWQLHQSDGDRCWDVTTLDANDNGWAEQEWVDLDNDCRWDTHLYNTWGGDNLMEELSYDMDENGRPEYVLQDTDQRIGYEFLYADADRDGRWDYPTAAPGSVGWAAAQSAPQPQADRAAADKAYADWMNMRNIMRSPGYKKLRF